MRGLAPFFFFVLTWAVQLPLQAQQYAPLRTFTMADGLPSNHIYTTIEDDKGFLWVATDAGIARFDGRKFQVFTLQDGLPDNEVLDVVKEKNGRIWVNCYRQSPAYFDPIQNRFISAKEDTVLATMKGSNLVNLFALPKGGVQYVNEKGSYVFDQGKVFFSPRTNAYKWYLLNRDSSGQEIHFSVVNQQDQNKYYISLLQNDRLVDSFVFALPHQYNARPYLKEGNFYFLYPVKGILVVFKQFKSSPFGFALDSIKVPEPITHVTFSAGWVNVVGGSGAIYVFEQKSLALKHVFKGDFTANSLCQDKQGNFWLGSIDKGLLLFKPSIIHTLPMPRNYPNVHLLSLARLRDGSLVAGNFNSELLFWKNGQFRLQHLPTPVSSFWQRKLIAAQGKLFSFSEGGSFVDLRRMVKKAVGMESVFDKTATLESDSSILVGTSRGLARLSVKTEKISLLHGPPKRVTAMAKTNTAMVYFGSTDGLYAYNTLADSGWGMQNLHPLFNERIVALCAAPEGWVWAATAGKGIFAFQGKRILAHFTQQDGLLSNTALTLFSEKAGELWMGSNDGLSQMRYKTQAPTWSIKVNNLTLNDGLSSNLINEILVHQDTVYLATGAGLSYFPKGFQVEVKDTKVALVGVKVNQRDTVISQTYDLKHDQGNLTLKLAAIDLGGHARYIEYRFKGQSTWSKLEESFLNLELNPGQYVLEFRAVDVNQNASQVSLVLRFNLATPFWKSWTFLVSCTLLLAVLISFWIIAIVRQKSQKEIAQLRQTQQLQDLEMRALRAQINPHFIFNCLSSIKSLTYQQKNKEAGLFIDHFSALLRNTLDFTSRDTIRLQEELAYSRHYLSLEKMRFGDRLQWDIQVAQGLDLDAWMVPPLILQPYLENAIKHGINHKTEGIGILVLTLTTTETGLHIRLADNGIGRIASQAIHAQDPSYHASKGLEISARRGLLFGANIQIEDLIGPHGVALGTAVDFFLPTPQKTLG